MAGQVYADAGAPTKTHIATQKVETLQVRLPKQFKLLNFRQRAIFMEVCSARGHCTVKIHCFA